MATFGSTINPSLGATDYSAILRGAQSQAQGILAGGQGIAQGISQAGQAIAQGIEKYQENKKATKAKEADLKSGIQFLESMTKVKGLNPEAQGAALGVLDYVNSGNVDLDTKLRAIGGAKDQMNMLIGLGQHAESQALKQREFGLQERELNAKIGGGMFDRPEKPVQSVVPMSLKQISDLRAQGIEVKGTPGENGMVNVGGFSSGAPPAQTNINMPDPSAKEVYSALAADREKVMAAFGDNSDDEAIKQLATGKAFTGMGAEQKLIAAKTLELFGVTSFNDEIKDTELMKALILRPAIAGAKQLGVNPTDKDLSFLLKVEAGEISLNKDTIKKVAEARIRLKENRIKAYNERLDSTYPIDDEGAKRYRGSLSLPSQAIGTAIQLSPAALKYVQ